MNIRLANNKDKKVIIPLANKVYYSSERDFWKEGYFRVDENEFNGYIKNQWLYIGEIEKEIVG